MAQLPSPFNPQAHRPATAEGTAATLPIGKWPMRVIANELKATKNDTNQGYLELTIEVLDGPAKGVTNAKWRFNLFNNSAQAVEIAHSQLTSLCYVVGWNQPLVNVDDLHGKPFIGCVTPQKNDPERTEISGCLDINGNDPGKGAAPAPAPQPAAYAPPQQQPAAAPAPAASWGAAPAQAPAAAPAWGGGAPAAAAPATGPAWGAAGGAAPAGGATPPWGAR